MSVKSAPQRHFVMLILLDYLICFHAAVRDTELILCMKNTIKIKLT